MTGVGLTETAKSEAPALPAREWAMTGVGLTEPAKERRRRLGRRLERL
jgi:hypothetical protein